MIDLRKQLIERRMIELDPDLAKHYLKYNTYKTQRVIRQPHVAELCDKIKHGLFRFGEVAFAEYKGSSILINGQHVCTAVIASGIAVPCMLEKFNIQDDLELSEAFRQFEILPRSLSDMIRVEADALKLGWPLMVSSVVVAAATLEKYGTSRLNHPVGMTTQQNLRLVNKDIKVALLREHLHEGEFINQILTSGGKSPGIQRAKHLKRAGVVMIMMQTWRKNHELATIFWENVRDGEQLTGTMPEKKLRDFLLTTRAVSHQPITIRTINPHEYAYRCILAWNAAIKNKPSSLAYHANCELPKIESPILPAYPPQGWRELLTK